MYNEWHQHLTKLTDIWVDSLKWQLILSSFGDQNNKKNVSVYETRCYKQDFNP